MMKKIFILLLIALWVVSIVSASENNAKFVSQDVPMKMVAGQTYQVSITMKNVGSTTWTAEKNYRLGSQNPQDNLQWGIGRAGLAANGYIGPADTKTFTFTVTAPKTPGTYNFQWRMVQEGVGWFGELTQNVEIDVQTVSNYAQFVSQSVPETMTAGKEYQVSVTMKNTGTTAWTKAKNYKLGSQNPQDNIIWVTQRAELGPAETIAPGQEKTFTFTVTAPSTPNNYNFQWKVVQEFVEWFGDSTQNVKVSVEELPNYLDVSSIMQTIKIKGCVFSGLLSSIEDYDNYLALLGRSNCEYIHRAVETWNSPPNFNYIQTSMGKVAKVKPDLVYGMFIAESIDTTKLYYYPDENRLFDFAAMCSYGTQGAFGTNTCKPSFSKEEYRKYLRYITRKAIDLGIQSFLFGQVYFQDDNLYSNPIADDIVAEIKSYATLKGKPVVVGAQTNDVSTDYLKIFDYAEGGLYQDVNGNLEEGDCLSTVASYCQALIWNSKYSAAKNRLVSLDWCCADDDMHRFAKMSGEKRAEFLKEKHDYFKSRGIGFLMTFRGIFNAGASEGSCYGYNKWVYSPDNLYSCKDEDAINFLLSQKQCSSEGEFCSGTGKVACCSGLKCQLEGTYADAGGKCVQTYPCDQIAYLSGTQQDASTKIQQCIDKAPADSIVELPPGKYYISHRLNLNKPLTLRTEGKVGSMPKCSVENHGCAELIASKDLYEYGGILTAGPATDVKRYIIVDHLVFNGNKAVRTDSPAGQKCSEGVNTYGGNVLLIGSNVKFTNSVSKNTLCATALGVAHPLPGVSKNKNILISKNTITSNGVHTNQLWSDGITLLDAVDSVITDNEIRDNSDVDLVLGGCVNCVVQNNKILHTEDIRQGSFAALVLHAWPGQTSGDYTNTDVSNNIIDCGSKKTCGFGLLIGSDAWYHSNPYGGSVHDNLIRNAQQSFSIDDAHDMEVYNNKVELPGSETATLCGIKQTSPYSIGSRSSSIDMSKDTQGITYSNIDWDGCIPNNAWIPPWSSVDGFVTHLYQCILDRSPDTMGFEHWKYQLVSGKVSIEGLYQEFFKSSEYSSKNVPNEDLVTQLYNCILFRSTAGDPGAAFWVDKLDSKKMSRTEVLNAFLSSTEFKKNIVPELKVLIQSYDNKLGIQDGIIEVCNKNDVCEIKQEENSDNCPEDCYCGDEICDSAEDDKTCPEDCRYCEPEWECYLEPAECPEEGIQNKVCTDVKCGTGKKREEALKCVPGICSGCLSNSVCYPVTTRILLDKIPSYCDITKTFTKQKDLGSPCQNNYECLSNECSDGKCIIIKKELEETQSLLKKILRWIKNIF